MGILYPGFSPEEVPMRRWWAALAWGLGTVGLLWAQVPSPPRGEETVEVHLQIIPFYVVDESGQPVLDLKPEEVQVLVDGKPHPIGHLDRYAFVPEGQPDDRDGGDPTVGNTAGRPLREANPSRRHVLLLFDLAFSSPRGFRVSREVSLQTCERILDSDLVYLLVFSGSKGLKRLWGPVSGRDRVCNLLRTSLGLKWGIQRAPSPDVDFPAEEGRNVEGTLSAATELEDYVREAQTFSQWTYQDIARRLAATFKQLAASLRPVYGPKLLIYFSQGIRNNVYFAAAYAEPVEQPIVPGQFPQLYGQDDRMASSFLHQEFEEAVRALAEAGVMTMVVNPEGSLMGADAPLSGENSLRHIARVTSGLYIEGTQEEHIRQQIGQWTAAYYEAGIYLRNREYKGKFHKVEVRLLRPGVRLWSLRGFRDPRPYRDFTPEERLSYAIQLIYGGVENLRTRPAHGRWLPLNGRPGGRVSPEERFVWFEAEFQPEWRGKKLDIFNIVFDGDPQGRVGSLRDSRAEQRKLPDGGTLRVENRLPWHGTFVWGVVVVEPDSGTTWWYRTLVHSPLDK
jgi:VWFA-related protein